MTMDELKERYMLMAGVIYGATLMQTKIPEEDSRLTEIIGKANAEMNKVFDLMKQCGYVSPSAKHLAVQESHNWMSDAIPGGWVWGGVLELVGKTVIN